MHGDVIEAEKRLNGYYTRNNNQLRGVERNITNTY